MTTFRSLSTLLVLALIGCGAEDSQSRYAESTRAPQAKSAAPIALAASDKDKAPGSTVGAMLTDGASAILVGTQATPTPAIARKIIYDAQIDLIVESVDAVAKKVAGLVQDARAYIAEQNVTGSPGSQRSMRWRIRVPVEQFESLVASIVLLGETERNNRTSQDVTEQYYDIEARIKNKRVEEQTLNKILQERSGKLEDVLKIEIELSRVRGEIEQLEGKIRVLENLSSLATLTLNVREREKYAPPPPVAADFPTQISRTWNASLLSLVNLGKSLLLWAVNWAVWIPFLLIFAVLGWVVLSWLLRVLVRNLPRLIALARTPITQPRAPTAGP
ncbi:MAG TPA: DUF4349 domain-containing protein [Isosphaeraceae bacterium]|nr:DUF4349 domain-containing protein [Isosphaeraceae bacterium]